MKLSILLIDDDPLLLQAMSRGLQNSYQNCVVDCIASGKAGLRKVKAQQYDCVVLDVGLPDMNGNKVCAAIRSHGLDMPVLMLSGDAYAAGAVPGEFHSTGYYQKTADPAALSLLYVNIISQAVHYHMLRTSDDVLSAPGIELRSGDNTVVRNGRLIALRPKERAILEFFLLNIGKLITREQINRYVWQGAYTGSNCVEVHIKHLRDGIDKPFRSNLIQTVRGYGYRFSPATEGATHAEGAGDA